MGTGLSLLNSEQCWINLAGLRKKSFGLTLLKKEYWSKIAGLKKNEYWIKIAGLRKKEYWTKIAGLMINEYWIKIAGLRKKEH